LRKLWKTIRRIFSNYSAITMNPCVHGLFQMVHDRKAAEDIVQDVFLALVGTAGGGGLRPALLPLLFVAVKTVP